MDPQVCSSNTGEFWEFFKTCFTSMFLSIYSLTNLLTSYSMPDVFLDVRNVVVNNNNNNKDPDFMMLTFPCGQIIYNVQYI